MTTQRSERWGFASITGSSGDLTVELIPALGAKIASIVWRGREILVQPRETVDWSRPRVDYEQAELCGWDEMFPTIVGAGYPDHGEVWSRQWVSVASHPGALDFAVSCASIPATFRRAIHFRAPHALELSYSVTNHASAPLSFLWAAHPQFVVDPHDEVRINGRSLDSVTEPRRRTILDASRIADLVPPRETGKWWNPLGERIDGVSIERSEYRILLTAVTPEATQWGVWIDRGAISQADVVSVQPALGWHDDLHRAVDTGTAPVVAPDGSLSWSLRLELSETSV